MEAGIDQSETAEVAAEEAGADTGAPESEEGQAPEKEATAEQEGDGL
jgi:hypothetical protein